QRDLQCDRQKDPGAAGEEYPARMIGRSGEETRMTYCFALVLGVALLAAPPVQATDDGAALFNASCAGCHGENGAGDTAIGKSVGAPDLRSSQVQIQPDSRITDVIENATRRMPA